MSVTYNKTNWVNYVTPLDADNMNNIENGIENLVNEFNAGSGGTITVDSKLSETSENPVQNKVVKAALDKKIEEPLGNGMVCKFMSGTYSTVPVNTTMPTSPTNNGIPTTKLLKDYVEDNTSNPLKLSDTNLQKSGLIAQSYTPAGSTPDTTGTTTYAVIGRDTETLDDSISGAGKIPSSYVVGQYVQAKIAAMTPVKGTDYFTEADKQEIINAVLAELSKQQ